MSFKSFKEFANSTKGYIGFTIVLFALFSAINNFTSLPLRVANAEETILDNKNSVDRLANTVEDYVILHKIYRKSHEKLHAESYKREKLLTDLILEVRRANNHHTDN